MAAKKGLRDLPLLRDAAEGQKRYFEGKPTWSYTANFAPDSTAWYMGSVSDRAQNLECIYATTIRAMVRSTPENVRELAVALGAIEHLFANETSVSLPHWMVAALLLFQGRLCLKQQNWELKGNLVWMLQKHCRLQCLTFLQIVNRHCQNDEYLLLGVGEARLFWVPGTGLPPMQCDFFVRLLRLIGDMFPHDRTMARLSNILCEML